MNQRPYLEDAIRSVLNQNYDNFEHIVVDGGSTDGTTELLESYDHVRWSSGPDGGQSHALNTGFSRATGDIVGWLNADDRYLPNAFERIVQRMAGGDAPDVLYGDFRFIDDAGQVTQLRRELDFDLFMLKYLHVLYIPSTATFFSRRVFDDGHLLDTDLHYAMDYEFYLRLAVNGYKFEHLSHFLADYRWHAASKSTVGSKAQTKEREAALLRHDTRLGELPRSVRIPLRSALRLAARGKRYALKASKGYYLTQWRSGGNPEEPDG